MGCPRVQKVNQATDPNSRRAEAVNQRRATRDRSPASSRGMGAHDTRIPDGGRPRGHQANASGGATPAIAPQLRQAGFLDTSEATSTPPERVIPAARRI